MNLALRHLGILTYGVLSAIESLVNLFLYATLLYAFIPVLDISLPFFGWWSNKVLKPYYMKQVRECDENNRMRIVK